MGYTTDFDGQFALDRPLTPEHRAYLVAFSETRRMKRDPQKAEAMSDPIRLAAGLPIGDEGAYFVGGTGFLGQDRDASILDYNESPGMPNFPRGSSDFRGDYAEYMKARSKAMVSGSGQPGLNCDWCPTEDGSAIHWNGAEKFYGYEAWLRYLIRHFLAPWGYTLNGEVSWRGEDHSDVGVLRVMNNEVSSEKIELKRATAN